MSYPILNSLSISMAKGLHKTPNFSTVKQMVAAGRGNAAIALKPYATWDFEFDMDHVLGNESATSSVLSIFFGTFMATMGGAGLFLFSDEQDDEVVTATSGMLNVTPGAASPMGTTGDGTSTKFQLARSIGGVSWDILQNINGTPTIYVNGTPTAAYSISSTGVVTFTTAPAIGATLTWSGSFYYLCRFSEDTVDTIRSFTTNSGIDQWDVNSIKFSSEFV